MHKRELTASKKRKGKDQLQDMFKECCKFSVNFSGNQEHKNVPEYRQNSLIPCHKHKYNFYLYASPHDFDEKS